MPIGILGGTFDPFHLGHAHIANEVLKKANLSSVYIIPCNQSPLRVQPIATPLQRLEMVKLGIAASHNLLLDDQEIKRQGISYTVDTLRNIRVSQTPDKPKTLALIMGIDAFNKFDAWHEWQNVLELAHLIIVNRQNIKFNLKNEFEALLKENQITNPSQLSSEDHGKILILDINPLPISATEIRHLIANGNFKKAQTMLSPSVWQYIAANKIYSNEQSKTTTTHNTNS